MEITKLIPEYEQSYDQFILEHKASLLYHTLKYRSFIEKLTSAESHYLIAIENGTIHGALPLMIKTGPLGKVINSLPYYGSNGGVICTDEKIKSQLLDHFKDLSSDCVSYTLIENPLDSNYPYASLELNESDFRIGQLTKLEGPFSDLEDMMKLFHYKTRNMIRKAIKSTISVEVENEMLGFLEQTHKENMEKIGGLAKTSVFFQSISSTFEANKDYKIFVARHEGTPIAALLLFYHNKVVEYYTPVIVSEYRNFQPMSLLISISMLEAANNGFEWWNWGGTWESQGGVFDFKSKWATTNIPYKYHIRINDPTLYERTKQELLSNYEGFFVLPFSKLKN